MSSGFCALVITTAVIIFLESAIFISAIKYNSYEELRNEGNPSGVKFVEVSISDEKHVFVCDMALFQGFTTLQDLSLINNGLLAITDECLVGLQKLKTIHLERNKLTNIDLNVFRQLRSISFIYISHNLLFTINFEDVILSEVKTFFATQNRLRTVSLTSRNLPKIRELNLRENLIEKISIESQTLTRLDLSFNRLKSISGDDLIIPNVKTLNLNDNYLEVITPESLINGLSLQWIYLGNNFLHTIRFPALKNLLLLNLSKNKFSSTTLKNFNIPECGEGCELNLNQNKVFELDSPLGTLSSISAFFCVKCSIHFIRSRYFGEYLKEMISLNLRDNYLENANIFEADTPFKLKWIDLSYNKIEKISRNDFNSLSEINTLLIKRNRILQIENNAFDNLVNLFHLDLSQNFIFELNIDLFKYTTALKVLYLNGNNLPYYPIPGWNEMTDEIDFSYDQPLTKLKTLLMYDNPLLCSCYDLLYTWTTRFDIELLASDEADSGKKPYCVIGTGTSQKCTKNIDRHYSDRYWYLFNNHSLFT